MKKMHRILVMLLTMSMIFTSMSGAAFGIELNGSYDPVSGKYTSNANLDQFESEDEQDKLVGVQTWAVSYEPGTGKMLSFSASGVESGSPASQEVSLDTGSGDALLKSFSLHRGEDPEASSWQPEQESYSLLLVKNKPSGSETPESKEVSYEGVYNSLYIDGNATLSGGVTVTDRIEIAEGATLTIAEAAELNIGNNGDGGSEVMVSGGEIRIASGGALNIEEGNRMKSLSSITVDEGGTLQIESNAELQIPDYDEDENPVAATLTNNGTINNNGNMAMDMDKKLVCDPQSGESPVIFEKRTLQNFAEDLYIMLYQQCGISTLNPSNLTDDKLIDTVVQKVEYQNALEEQARIGYYLAKGDYFYNSLEAWRRCYCEAGEEDGEGGIVEYHLNDMNAAWGYVLMNESGILGRFNTYLTSGDGTNYGYDLTQHVPTLDEAIFRELILDTAMSAMQKDFDKADELEEVRTRLNAKDGVFEKLHAAIEPADPEVEGSEAAFRREYWVDEEAPENHGWTDGYWDVIDCLAWLLRSMLPQEADNETEVIVLSRKWVEPGQEESEGHYEENATGYKYALMSDEEIAAAVAGGKPYVKSTVYTQGDTARVWDKEKAEYVLEKVKDYQGNCVEGVDFRKYIEVKFKPSENLRKKEPDEVWAGALEFSNCSFNGEGPDGWAMTVFDTNGWDSKVNFNDSCSAAGEIHTEAPILYKSDNDNGYLEEEDPESGLKAYTLSEVDLNEGWGGHYDCRLLFEGVNGLEFLWGMAFVRFESIEGHTSFKLNGLVIDANGMEGGSAYVDCRRDYWVENVEVDESTYEMQQKFRFTLDVQTDSRGYDEEENEDMGPTEPVRLICGENQGAVSDMLHVSGYIDISEYDPRRISYSETLDGSNNVIASGYTIDDEATEIEAGGDNRSDIILGNNSMKILSDGEVFVSYGLDDENPDHFGTVTLEEGSNARVYLGGLLAGTDFALSREYNEESDEEEYVVVIREIEFFGKDTDNGEQFEFTLIDAVDPSDPTSWVELDYTVSKTDGWQPYGNSTFGEVRLTEDGEASKWINDGENDSNIHRIRLSVKRNGTQKLRLESAESLSCEWERSRSYMDAAQKLRELLDQEKDRLGLEETAYNIANDPEGGWAATRDWRDRNGDELDNLRFLIAYAPEGCFTIETDTRGTEEPEDDETYINPEPWGDISYGNLKALLLNVYRMAKKDKSAELPSFVALTQWVDDEEGGEPVETEYDNYYSVSDEDINWLIFDKFRRALESTEVKDLASLKTALAAAVSAQSGEYREILINGNVNVTENLDVPSNVYMELQQGNTLTIAAGSKLTLKGKDSDGTLLYVRDIENIGNEDFFMPDEGAELRNEFQSRIVVEEGATLELEKNAILTVSGALELSGSLIQDSGEIILGEITRYTEGENAGRVITTGEQRDDGSYKVASFTELSEVTDDYIDSLGDLFVFIVRSNQLRLISDNGYPDFIVEAGGSYTMGRPTLLWVGEGAEMRIAGAKDGKAAGSFTSNGRVEVEAGGMIINEGSTSFNGDIVLNEGNFRPDEQGSEHLTGFEPHVEDENIIKMTLIARQDQDYPNTVFYEADCMRAFVRNEGSVTFGENSLAQVGFMGIFFSALNSTVNIEKGAVFEETLNNDEWVKAYGNENAAKMAEMHGYYGSEAEEDGTTVVVLTYGEKDDRGDTNWFEDDFRGIFWFRTEATGLEDGVSPTDVSGSGADTWPKTKTN